MPDWILVRRARRHATLSLSMSLLGFMLLLSAAHADQPPPTGQGAKEEAFTLGDPVAGKAVYGSCMTCHALDSNGSGPKHRGVVGRKAGTASGFNYSGALRKSGITWTPAMIDKWLQDPREMVPGTRMFFSLTDAKERADVIAYLATEK